MFVIYKYGEVTTWDPNNIQNKNKILVEDQSQQIQRSYSSVILDERVGRNRNQIGSNHGKKEEN